MPLKQLKMKAILFNTLSEDLYYNSEKCRLQIIRHHSKHIHKVCFWNEAKKHYVKDQVDEEKEIEESFEGDVGIFWWVKGQVAVW